MVLTGRQTIPTTTTAALQSRNITLRFDIGFRTIPSPAWECVHSGADCGPSPEDPFGLATETRRTRRETIVVRRPWSVARSRGCQVAVDRLHFSSSPPKTGNRDRKTQPAHRNRMRRGSKQAGTSLGSIPSIPGCPLLWNRSLSKPRRARPGTGPDAGAGRAVPDRSRGWTFRSEPTTINQRLELSHPLEQFRRPGQYLRDRNVKSTNMKII